MSWFRSALTRQGEQNEQGVQDEVIHEKNVITSDPRAADYWPEHLRFPEDSHLWDKLLTMAAQENELLARNLHGFRGDGTRVIKLKNGNFGLRPVIRPAGSDNPDEGWMSMEDYKKYAQMFLAPYHDLIVRLLGRLRDEEKAEKSREEGGLNHT